MVSLLAERSVVVSIVYFDALEVRVMVPDLRRFFGF